MSETNQMAGTLTAAQLVQRNRELAARLAVAERAAHELRHRTALAEKSARDSWAL